MSSSAHDTTTLRLSISIVCYHSDAVLLQCTLQSVHEALAQLPHTRTQLCVIDNAQQETELAKVLQQSPWRESVELLTNETNLGFGTANNQAIVRAESDYHLVLNPDVGVDANALCVALEYLQQHPEVVAVSPACVNARGEEESLCKRFPSVLVLLLRGFAPSWLKKKFAKKLRHYECQDLISTHKPVAVPLISGCFLLARTSVLQEVSGFDQRYFLYFEDFALSKALAAHGELHHVPACKIVHHGGNAARKGLRHVALFIRSAFRFFQQYGWKLC